MATPDELAVAIHKFMALRSAIGRAKDEIAKAQSVLDKARDDLQGLRTQASQSKAAVQQILSDLQIPPDV